MYSAYINYIPENVQLRQGLRWTNFFISILSGLPSEATIYCGEVWWCVLSQARTIFEQNSQ